MEFSVTKAVPNDRYRREESSGNFVVVLRPMSAELESIEVTFQIFELGSVSEKYQNHQVDSGSFPSQKWYQTIDLDERNPAVTLLWFSDQYVRS